MADVIVDIKTQVVSLDVTKNLSPKTQVSYSENMIHFDSFSMLAHDRPILQSDSACTLCDN